MSRYSDVVIESQDQLYRAFRYAALNPVKAGLCREPREWEWSSYAGTIGATPSRRFVDDRLLKAPLSLDAARARELLRSMVEDLGWPDWTAPSEGVPPRMRNAPVTGSDPASDRPRRRRASERTA